MVLRCALAHSTLHGAVACAHVHVSTHHAGCIVLPLPGPHLITWAPGISATRVASALRAGARVLPATGAWRGRSTASRTKSPACGPGGGPAAVTGAG